MKRLRFTSLLLAALAAATFLVAAGSATQPASAIIGGQAAANGQFPFMAAITDNSGFAYCGGTVIASQWVLTAAHCMVDEKPSGVRVITGRTNLSDTSTGQWIQASQIFVHPGYDGNGHDAALIKLQTATTSPAIQLAVAANDNLEAAGTPVTTVGWGDTLPTLGLFATDQLRYVDLHVVSDNECGQTNFGFDAPTGVCAADLLNDSCNGDSGGPLFGLAGSVKVQIGIVSYGTSCALPKFPGVYSEVNNASIRSWITATSGV